MFHSDFILVYFVHNIFVEPACGERDKVITTSARCMRVGECVVCSACIRPDLFRPKLIHLYMDFRIIWHSCCSREVLVPLNYLFR